MEGSIPPADIRELARRVASSGYTSFWINIAPGVSDPVQMLLALDSSATPIDVGIGAVPIDRYSIPDILAQAQAAGLKWERIILGIGGGHTKQGMLAHLETSIGRLRDLEPTIRVGIAGYGPKVLELGGRLADALCLAWMTLDGLSWAKSQAHAGALSAGRPDPPIYAYVRCAIGADALARVETEVAKNAKYGWYPKHLERMGTGLLGLPLDGAADLATELRAYGVHAEPVVRPILRDPRDMDEWHEMVELLAPSRANVQRLG